jgi:hypothetical protein
MQPATQRGRLEVVACAFDWLANAGSSDAVLADRARVATGAAVRHIELKVYARPVTGAEPRIAC